MFKKLGERMNELSRDMEDIKMTKIEPIEIKATICRIKNTLYGNNAYYKLLEKKISEIEDITIGTIHNETQRKKTEKNEQKEDQ